MKILLILLLMFIVGCNEGGPAQTKYTNDTSPPATYTRPSYNNTTTSTSTSNQIGDNKFLWKPVGENSKKLVVLIPAKYTGMISTVFIATSSGKPIEQGNFSGVHNGNREHFRFSKQGGEYPNGCKVVADLKSGGSQYWTINNTSQRTSL